MLKSFFGRGMRGYNFTEHVRRALARAREESVRLRHEYVGTEHILLGLLRRDDGDENLAITIVRSLGGDLDSIEMAIETGVAKGRDKPTGPDLPYTSRAKQVLELAMTEARDLNHSYVGTEHLLLGLLAERRGIAAQVLVSAGITLDAARAKLVDILEQSVSRETRPAAETPRRRARSLADVASPESASMAASIIELLAQDDGVSSVFAAQGIDVAKLAAALRSIGAPPADAAPPAA